jgi:CAAX prenyl protease-like protein
MPFALFMMFIGANELAVLLARQGVLDINPLSLNGLYPVKALAVALVLFYFRQEYREISWKDLAQGKQTAAALLVGVATCVLWVVTDWTNPVSGIPQGFNPASFSEGPVRVLMTSTRIAGAVLVVPLMEELFWRSFLLRYLIDQNFESVPVGSFSWPSFLATTVLFGLEHHFIIAGMLAGAIYSLLLYRTRSLAQCVLAHAVTNLALAGYVLYTGKWYFW